MPAPRPEPDAYLALADQTRRRILELLSTEELTVNELTGRLPVRQPTVSEHLAVLRSVGLVSAEKDGRQRIYRLRQETIAEVRGWLRQIASARPAPRQPTARIAEAHAATAPASAAAKPAAPQPARRDDWAVWD